MSKSSIIALEEYVEKRNVGLFGKKEGPEVCLLYIFNACYCEINIVLG